MGFVSDLFNKPKPPKVPDPQQTAATQAQYNLQAQRSNIAANRLNQTTPYGSVNYQQTGTDQYGNPTYSVNTQLSPQQQAILTQLQGNQQQLGQTAGSLIGNVSGQYSQAPDFSNQAGSLTSQMLDRQLAYLNPYYTQQTENLEAQLRNQGLEPGSVAYDRALRTLQQNQNQSVGTFLNQAQQQAFTQAMQQYQQPLNVIQQLLGMSQPTNNLMLQTPPSANMNAVDFSGIQNQTQQALNQQYQQQQAQYGGLLNAVGTGLSTIMGAPTGSLFGNITGNAAGGLSQMLGLGNATSFWGTPRTA